MASVFYEAQLFMMSGSFPFTIRKADSKRDLGQVASLVHRSFRPWLEPDSDEYLKRMENADRQMKRFPLLYRFREPPFLLNGLVCEDKGRIIGNISWFNAAVDGDNNALLIANVSVDPEYRRQGIAQRMLDESVERAKNAGVTALYLQARECVPFVVDMYRQNGFSVTDHRVTWIAPKTNGSSGPNHIPSVSISLPRREHMARIRHFFRTMYPDSVIWNLENHPESMIPGWFGKILNLFSGNGSEFLAVGPKEHPFGWFYYRQGRGFTDTLWVIPNVSFQDKRLSILLREAARRYTRKKALLVNAPENIPDEIFFDGGFFLNERICWMKRKI